MNLAAFTQLAGGKVTLRRFEREDITEAYIAWLNDPEVTRYSNQRFRTHTRASCEAYLASFAGSHNLFLSVRDAASGVAIGTMTAYANPHHGTCDVGIMIGAREVWGGGYGSEAWNLLTDWLVSDGDVRKLTAGCLAVNAAMIRLMERSGMTCEAVRVGQELLDGAPCDIVHYARFADG
ncbi:MAG: GNAT family N-acetyltransferase [Erythrobacter sp.]|uniref:GNAT family N-acetyltransferase n=1 Tax=Erythrobacter sp. TaxID=1042 RepID=UPI0026302EFB|nr:GNAT family N-acetyltransferase [Erythrobacter sp.]MDJ0978401.1 GNAT family N-acetyltransferase [Erythrobacter sp.]